MIDRLVDRVLNGSTEPDGWDRLLRDFKTLPYPERHRVLDGFRVQCPSVLGVPAQTRYEMVMNALSPLCQEPLVFLGPVTAGEDLANEILSRQEGPYDPSWTGRFQDLDRRDRLKAWATLTSTTPSARLQEWIHRNFVSLILECFDGNK